MVQWARRVEGRARVIAIARNGDPSGWRNPTEGLGGLRILPNPSPSVSGQASVGKKQDPSSSVAPDVKLQASTWVQPENSSPSHMPSPSASPLKHAPSQSRPSSGNVQLPSSHSAKRSKLHAAGMRCSPMRGCSSVAHLVAAGSNCMRWRIGAPIAGIIAGRSSMLPGS